jgi:hypothetical protein
MASLSRHVPDSGQLDRLSPAGTKIALFRSLFRGRADVYARRFVSRRTGQAGYSPACGNEWQPGVCEKPKIKCTACLHQRFLPVTDDVTVRYKMVFTTSRMHTVRGRPPRVVLAGGISGAIIAHCASVRSVGYNFRRGEIMSHSFALEECELSTIQRVMDRPVSG